MMRIYPLVAPLIFAATFTAATAQEGPSDCRVRISAVPTGWVIKGYDPFGNGSPEASFSATFFNDSAAECNFSPVFQLDQPPFGLSKGIGNPVRYVLLNQTDAQDATPRAGRSQSLLSQSKITLSAGASRTMIFKLVADPDDIKAAGLFTQDVTLEAQDQTFRTLGGTRLVLGLEVMPSARIGLAGAFTMQDGRAMVDLGELREGPAPVPLQLRLQSIGNYEISVTSQNSGRLRLGATEWQVPYSLAIGGKSVNLSNGTLLKGASDSIRVQKESLPIEFLIGDVSNRRAGAYSDVISIAVTSR